MSTNKIILGSRGKYFQGAGGGILAIILGSKGALTPPPPPHTHLHTHSPGSGRAGGARLYRGEYNILSNVSLTLRDDGWLFCPLLLIHGDDVLSPFPHI